MDSDTPRIDLGVATLERPFELELADGSRLVPQAEARPARVEGGSGHAITLADVQRAGGEPFQGYRRERA